jgi:DNA-binding response OmpR family regulator
VGKPFLYEELLVRMRAVLRRASGPRRSTVCVNDLTIDVASRTVRVASMRCCPRRMSLRGRGSRNG